VTAGVAFDRGPAGPALGLEAGHGRRRIVRAGGGATGSVLSAALLERAAAHPGITIHTHTAADALLRERERVVGVRSGGRAFRGRAVVLATGGYAGLWGRTTNAAETSGGGLILAWRAGARLADLEFVQFHPTALVLPGRPAHLLTEALRGEGARLVDERERPVIDPLLPRDHLARAIARHRWERGPVYLSLRHLDAADAWRSFSSLADRLDGWGLDLARDLLPVAPAAHYCMGGVRADTEGRTGVSGLYAAGEAACTGAQGANRLASNSLLECIVFGGRTGLAALRDDAGGEGGRTRPLPESPEPPGSAAVPDDAPLGARLDRRFGVERDAQGLAALLASLPEPDDEATPPDAALAALAARAALLRTESRGAHYRTDAPECRERWRGRIHWRRGHAPQFEEVSAP
jgi:L-aspartate oxidase